MDCKLKMNINGYAVTAVGKTSPTEIADSIKSATQIYDTLDDGEMLASADNISQAIADRTAVKRALKDIPLFAEHGLLIVPEDNHISEAGDKLISRLTTTQEHGLGFVNGIKGGLSSVNVYDNVRILKADGKVKSQHSAETLNTMVKQVLGTLLEVNDSVYFVQTGEHLRVTRSLNRDINRFLYNEYLGVIGQLADGATAHDANTPRSFKRGARQLKNGPILSHIRKRIESAKQARRENKATAGNPSVDAKLSNDLTVLDAQFAQVTKALDNQGLVDYFNDAVVRIQGHLSSGEHIPDAAIATYLDTLQMLKRAATLTDDNHILDYGDMQNADLVGIIQGIRNTAETLERSLQDMALTSVLDSARELYGEELTREDLKTIGNLESGPGQLFSKFLGLHHIDNTLVQYVGTIVDEQNHSANSNARILNNSIVKEAKAAEADGFKVNTLFQKDSEGSGTGFTVGKFSSTYWTDYWNLQNNFKSRKNLMISMDPELLFDKKNATSPRRTALIALLEEQLGKFTFDMYMEEAEHLWNNYEAAKASYTADMAKDPMGKKKLALWIRDNDPTYRLNNYNNTAKDANRGSDKYMKVVPRRTTAEGKLTGLHDATFDVVESTPAAMKLYKLVIEANQDYQESLGNYAMKLKPPVLGHIGISTADHLAEGDIGAFVDAVWENAKSSYGPTNMLHKHIPIDKSTGEYAPQLMNELHTIPEEIRYRTKKELAQNDLYQEVLEFEPRGKHQKQKRKDQLAAIYKETKQRVANEVDTERSNNFVQSIVLTNYATAELVAKKTIEAKINLAKYIMKSNVTSAADKGDQFKAAFNTANEALEHFLNKKFYNVKDNEKPLIFTQVAIDRINAERAEEGKEALEKATPAELERINERLKAKGKEPIQAYSTEILGNLAVEAARVTFMGWSVPTAIANAFQGTFSNMLLAIEGKDFTVRQWISGMFGVFDSKKRKILDNLYIYGDLAFLFDKRNIHEAQGWKRKLKALYMQTSVEKVNQGSVALAILDNFEVTNSKTGEKKSMLDAFNDDASLSKDWVSDEYKGVSGMDLVTRVIIRKVRPTNMEGAGDYFSSPVVQRTALGKLALLFTRFLPEMFMSRFGFRKMDRNRGREIQGRYQGLFNVITNNYFVKDSSRTDELDKRGAKVAIAEMLGVLGVSLMFLAAKANLCDTKKCKEQRWAVLVGLNILSRFQSDVFGVMLTPLALAKKGASPIASATLIKDYAKFVNDFSSWMLPGGEPGTYKTDTDFYEEGDMKARNSILAIIPGVRSNYRNLYRNMGNSLQPNWATGLFEDGNEVKTKKKGRSRRSTRSRTRR